MTAACDVVIVGSGPSAVNAAYPLVAAGHAVRMLDVGNRDGVYERAIPDGPFSELRRTDPEQHRYLLGERFEGIAFDHMGSGAQLTPPRQYVVRDAERLLPIRSSSFFPLQSLAEGGLGAAWGAGSPAFTAEDLAGCPVSHADLQPHYEAVAARIGVSGARDDLAPFLGELAAMQPALDIDSNGASILGRYEHRRAAAHRAGLYLGKPRLAILSQPLRGRQANPYWDMDFWSDAGRSVYRPRWTLDELRGFPNFTFVGRQLVERFTERPSGEVVVTARDVDSGAAVEHAGRRLVLAAGTLGTARIVLRSLGHHGRRVPLVCNPHSYLALFNLNSVGRPLRDARHSMAQLCVVHAPGGAAPVTVGHYYSYRSLLLFRLIKDSPLPVRQALEILRLLSPNFGVLILQHRDSPSPTKHCTLERAGGDADRLAVEYALAPAEQAEHDATEAAISRALRRLGCVRMRTMRPGHAASTHFAGTFPMAAHGDELTTDARGRLRATRHVHLADGSVFPSLPSKGLTFTMMANADRIGTQLAGELAS